MVAAHGTGSEGIRTLKARYTLFTDRTNGTTSFLRYIYSGVK